MHSLGVKAPKLLTHFKSKNQRTLILYYITISYKQISKINASLLFIAHVYYKHKGLVFDVYDGLIILDRSMFDNDIKYDKKRNIIYSLSLLLLSSIIIMVTPSVRISINNSILLNKQKRMISVFDKAKTTAGNSEMIERQLLFGLSLGMDEGETFQVSN